jgi:hypothetical protein
MLTRHFLGKLAWSNIDSWLPTAATLTKSNARRTLAAMMLMFGLMIGATSAHADVTAKITASVNELLLAKQQLQPSEFMNRVTTEARRMAQETIAEDPDVGMGLSNEIVNEDTLFEWFYQNIMLAIDAVEEEARKERCAATKRLFDAFVCTSRPTVAPTRTPDLEISGTYQRVDIWGSAALGLATRSFDGALTLGDYQRALREAIDYCKEDKTCISEVMIYFGLNTFPTYNTLTDFLNWFVSFVSNQFSERDYRDSAAAQMAAKWELGAACNTLRRALQADRCGS